MDSLMKSHMKIGPDLIFYNQNSKTGLILNILILDLSRIQILT